MSRHWFLLETMIRVHNNLLEIIFPIVYYGGQISRHRLTYATSGANSIRVVRPLSHRIFDWFSFLFGLTSLISLLTDDRVHRLLSIRVFHKLMPPVGRNQMFIVLVMWTVMRFAFNYWVLASQCLQRYVFMAVFTMCHGQGNLIVQKELGLWLCIGLCKIFVIAPPSGGPRKLGSCP